MHTISELDETAGAFADLRPRLLAIATRIVGDVGDAEDIVQDTWIRWQLCDRSVVDNPTAFLVTTTSRLAINLIQSARARHETAVGEWAPEPVDRSSDPVTEIERFEAIGHAIEELVQRLSPAERAAFVLRRGFGYGYPRIAALLGTTAVNARQLVSRALRHLADERGLPADPGACQQLAHAMRTGARDGDLVLLERILVDQCGPAGTLASAA